MDESDSRVIDPSATAQRTAETGHVCMIVHSRYPVGEARGEREALTAVEAGYTVHVICLRAANEASMENIDGVGIVRLPIEHIRETNTLRFFGEYVRFALRATFAVLRLHRRHPIDVVYVHAPPDFLVVSALLPKLLGSSVVLDIHDLSSHMFNVRFRNRRGAGLVERLLRLVERCACAAADRVVTVHDAYRDELQANGVAPGKIAVVMNAPALEPVRRARAGAGRHADPDSFVVAYHGTINHWYGVDLLVRALADLNDRLPSLAGLIIGDGDALASVERLADELGIREAIEFSGAFVANEEALSRVAGANCGVIPNRRTPLNRFALSSKLLEYVALGIPVAVARLETLAAHFSPDEVTFFEPDDVASLVDAIAWIAAHPDESREKAERAQRRAESYSWSTSRARLLDVISSLVTDDQTRVSRR
jgi:glycosyltransferase involved in cell wall biosynthesis